MKNEKKLSDELLKCNGAGRGQMPGETRDELHRLILRDKMRVRRMKWAMIISWSLVVLWLGGGGLLEALLSKGPSEIEFPGILVVVAMALPYIAIICTVSYFVRSRSLTSRQIQARLANVEEQLLRMAKSQERGEGE